MLQHATRYESTLTLKHGRHLYALRGLGGRDAPADAAGGYPQSPLRLTAPSTEGAKEKSPQKKTAYRRLFSRTLAPHGRGGSVSRRDLNPAAGKRAQLIGGTK